MLDELKKIGLSENEAEVYIALLELGSATAQEIAAKSGIKRTTIYVQIEALMKMGLVTSFEKEMSKGKAPKTYFRAEDPEHLKNIVENEKRQAVYRCKILGNLEDIKFQDGELSEIKWVSLSDIGQLQMKDVYKKSLNKFFKNIQ